MYRPGRRVYRHALSRARSIPAEAPRGAIDDGEDSRRCAQEGEELPWRGGDQARAVQGLRVLRRVLPARRARAGQGLQREGLSPAVLREARGLQRLRHVRPHLPRLRDLRLPREARQRGLRNEDTTMSNAESSGVLTGSHYLDGDHACSEGAIAAGCRFASGYPITPSTEVVERLSQRFPQCGGRFQQFEDELAASIALQGATWGGAKTITVTSGPGFS